MNQESLEKVQKKVVDILNNVDINTIDKIELLINLMHFLNPEEYENNIQMLEEHRIKKIKFKK